MFLLLHREKLMLLQRETEKLYTVFPSLARVFHPCWMREAGGTFPPACAGCTHAHGGHVPSPGRGH